MSGSELYWQVMERLVADETVGDAGPLVAAALDGPEALSSALDHPLPLRSAEARPERARPPEVWLRQVSLRAFRGIGPEVALDLSPEPGLVLIVGRNGSGKSSLAEGLEVLLTGNAHRLHGLSADWKDGWRNLHHPEPPRVEAQVAVEGKGAATLRRTWDDGAKLDGGRVEARVGGRPTTLDELGWREALVTWRPFLGAGELVRSLDKGPSQVFDALQGILGLQELTEAGKLLGEVRKDAKRKVDELKQARATLVERASVVDDPRAAEVVRLLKARRVDLDALQALITEAPQDPELASELAVLGLSLPTEERVLAAVGAVRDAAAAVEACRDTLADQERRAAEVLRAALAWHEGAVDPVCPTCRVTPLDEGWRERAERWRQEHEQASRLASDAARALSRAEGEARSLIVAVPDAIVGGSDPELEETWRAQAAGALLGGTALADHLERMWPELAVRLLERRRRAEERVRSRDEGFRPLALAVAAHVEQALATEGLPDRMKRLDDARRWLEGAEKELRDERFEPLAKRACEIWSELRQGSHVELARVSLVGNATRRRVELAVSVDGAEGVALGVMSQGEVGALALSLFLPRLTLPDSPFRFLVVDDPVQAMDPYKVDGLARVLAEVARTRQVVVLTHDPRLAEAVRRARIPARVLEVQRRPGSVVELREALDPVTQHLRDAGQVMRNAPDLGAKVVERVVPGLCRSAVEARLVGLVRQRMLAAGRPYAEVEDAIEACASTHELAALALYDDARRGGDVLSTLNNRHGRWAGDLLQALKRGAHHPVSRLEPLVDDTWRLVRALEGRP
ncbi:MAG: AAA family ATPase [Alphaproteobacteria bacterium]|nr:AAA family ATPase [Alphaproteobacteria bacterium]